eukprot:5392988-Pleurochrysis_carterae.AAC.2
MRQGSTWRRCAQAGHIAEPRDGRPTRLIALQKVAGTRAARPAGPHDTRGWHARGDNMHKHTHGRWVRMLHVGPAYRQGRRSRAVRTHI